MCIQSAGNKIISHQHWSEVKQDMLGGEGLAQPMAKREIFSAVNGANGLRREKTGNLGNT